MKVRDFSFLLVTMFAAAALASCGGGSTSGGGAVFNTVTVDAEYIGASPLDSDVANHTDASTDNCGVSGIDEVTFLPDTADFTITSTVIPDLPTDFIPSDVRIQSVTIIYTPSTVPAAPAIPAQYYALSAIVPSGGSVTIPVMIASQFMKSTSPLSDLICGGGPYSYYVTVIFKGNEVTTEKDHSFETNFSINFADFIDQ